MSRAEKITASILISVWLYVLVFAFLASLAIANTRIGLDDNSVINFLLHIQEYFGSMWIYVLRCTF